MMEQNLCKETQQLLLQNQDDHRPVPEENRRHLEECPECRDFCRILGFLEAAAPARASMDSTTLRLCKAQLRRRRRQVRRLWALCASFLVICTLSGAMLISRGRTERAVLPSRYDSSAGQLEALAMEADFSMANEELCRCDLELDLMLTEADRL